VVESGRARFLALSYSTKCPLLAFGEVSNALAVVEFPTDAQTPIHTRSLRNSFFQATGAYL
jgi:hypothetical protein